MALSIGALAAEPEYVANHREVEVARPASDVWARVGEYCDISAWLSVDCKVTSGDGGVGTLRVLAGGRVSEILVGKTDLSYGYTQPAREGQLYNLYHGFLEAKPVTAKSSRLTYTLVSDESDKADAAAKEADVAKCRTAFESAPQTVNRIAESN